MGENLPSYEGSELLVVRLPTDLIDSLRMYSQVTDISMQHVVATALTETVEVLLADPEVKSAMENRIAALGEIYDQFESKKKGG